MGGCRVQPAPPDDVGGLAAALAPSRERVAHHPVFDRLDSERALHVLAEHHVVAVWDLANLLDALRPHVAAAGLDVPVSVDVDAYVAAMDEVGARTGPVRRFLALVRAGVPVRAALVMAEVPAGARRFATSTSHTAATGSALEQATMLCVARDELAPPALRRAVAACGPLARWLDDHLPDDGGACTATAYRLLATLCRSADDWRLAEATASEVLAARARLWDAVEAALDGSVVTAGAARIRSSARS